MKFYYIIRLDKDSPYYLSKRYESAAELVLGYGGTWTSDKHDFMLFRTLNDAKREINKMRHYGCGRNATTERYAQ